MVRVRLRVSRDALSWAAATSHLIGLTALPSELASERAFTEAWSGDGIVEVDDGESYLPRRARRNGTAMWDGVFIGDSSGVSGEDESIAAWASLVSKGVCGSAGDDEAARGDDTRSWARVPLDEGPEGLEATAAFLEKSAVRKTGSVAGKKGDQEPAGGTAEGVRDKKAFSGCAAAVFSELDRSAACWAETRVGLGDNSDRLV